jgi:hypothetical protein
LTSPSSHRPTGLTAKVFSLPKLGRTATENEDFAAIDLLAGRFAVADGASTSARPEVWSRLLVECFVGRQDDPLAPAILADLRHQWNAEVDRPNLPWYAQAKLLEGGGSTFLGLQIDLTANLFQAEGVGDSCLFHVRRGDVLKVGPIDSPGQFSRYPELVSTRANAATPKQTVLAGTYQPGDVFLLATDAIAKLLLETHEQYGRIPATATLVGDRTQFIRKIARYRRRGRLANDDTTLCVVRT